MYILIILITILPVLVELLYHTCFKNFLLVRQGELLGYYSVAFGICVPVSQYFYGKRQENKLRNKELKPIITVDLEWDADNNYTYNLTITKLSDNIIKEVFLYWEPLTSVLNGKQTFKLGFDSKYIADGVLDFSNINDNNLIDDEDGYPKYIVLSCYDAENQLWQCEYNKITHGEKASTF